jgi:hypothetical protein
MADHVTQDARWAAWILACVLPIRDVEPIVGDLHEESVQRAHAGAGNASLWFWGQVIRSIAPLVWTSVRRGGLATTGAVAVGACVLQAAIELASQSVLSAFLVDTRATPLLTAAIALPALALVSYAAARVRAGAAILVIGVVVCAMVLQLLIKDGISPTRLIVLVASPLAAFAGGALSLNRAAFN